jgi:hypothetical protein
MTVATGHPAPPTLADRGGHSCPSRQFGYPSSFRVQVYRDHVPSHVSRRWFSPRDASLPSFGSQRAWFPALVGTMKALRLPICVSVVTYFFASTAHTILLTLCPPQRSREGGGPSKARAWLRRRPAVPAPSCGRRWDLSGLQATLPVPLLRSGTPVEPTCPCHDGHVDAAPAG